VIAITGSGVQASQNLKRRSSSDGAHLLSRLAMTSTQGIDQFNGILVHSLHLRDPLRHGLK
jgi:hypothetical protein